MASFVLEKVMRKPILPVDVLTNVLDFDRACYPRYYDGERVAKYCVPIQGAYHEKLFPEISFRVPLPLFSAPGLARERTASPNQERTPGNTIRNATYAVLRRGASSLAIFCYSICQKTTDWNGRRASQPLASSSAGRRAQRRRT